MTIKLEPSSNSTLILVQSYFELHQVSGVEQKMVTIDRKSSHCSLVLTRTLSKQTLS